MRKLRVAILFGGRSAEHEVSLLSARAILRSLDRNRFTPVLIGIDKSGHFHLQDEQHLLENVPDMRQLRLGDSQGELSFSPVPEAGSQLRTLASGETMGPIDVVFPVLHGTYGEDGTIQGFLELAGLPYVGAGVLGSAVGMDKDVMKRLLRDAGLPIVDFRTLHYREFVKDPEAVARKAAEVGFPCFIKPANAGSSVGVSKVKTPAELPAALAHAFTFDNKVLSEKGIDAREIECSVLGNEEPQASVPGEIMVTHQDGFYSYDAKYVDEKGASLQIPAPLSEELTEKCRSLAIKAFQALECSGMARVDLFLERGTDALYLNEINTIPGFTAISMYPKLWEHSGISFGELVSRLLDLAIERHEARKRLKTERG